MTDDTTPKANRTPKTPRIPKIPKTPKTPTSSKQPKTPKPAKAHTPPPTGWERFCAFSRRATNVLMVIVNIVCAVALVVTGFAGHISPERVHWACLGVMAFSFALPVCLMVFVLDLIWWRKTAWIMGLSMIACVSPISDYMPLNIPRFGMSRAQKDNSFTLMTYNVCKFLDYPERDVDSSVQLDYILHKQPDVVCIQESNYLAPNPNNHITQQQLDSLHIIYPYVFTQGEDLALFSKFPTEPINIDYPTKKMGGGSIAAWRLHIHDRVVNIFSVHLQSLGLTEEDKEAYEEVVKLDSISRGEIRDLRHEVLPKIYEASIHRLEQIRQLQKYLGKYGGRDAIVCGDFNDPVGCYGIHLLCDESHMRQAYAQAGFGPDYTFYANNLYFRIDHILYRGNIDPYRINVRHIKASDHYPVIATLILN